MIVSQTTNVRVWALSLTLGPTTLERKTNLKILVEFYKLFRHSLPYSLVTRLSISYLSYFEIGLSSVAFERRCLLTNCQGLTLGPISLTSTESSLIRGEVASLCLKATAFFTFPGRVHV